MSNKYRYLIIYATLWLIFASGVSKGKIISYWGFDYGSVNDLYGDSHCKAVGYPDWVSGREGTDDAIEFNGADYISVENSSKYDISEQITLSAWIKVYAFDAGWHAIITKGDNSWRLQRYDDTNKLEIGCSGLGVEGTTHGNLSGGTNINDGRWHHVAGTYDGAELRLYVDGELDASIEASGAINITDHPVLIGENSEKRNRNFKGMIDEVAVFDHALSPEHIRLLCDEGIKPLIIENDVKKYVKESTDKAASMEPRQAVAYIKSRMAEEARWLRNQKDVAIVSEMNFLIARAMSAAELPLNEVIEAYKHSVTQRSERSEYIAESLLWLSMKLSADDFKNVVKEWINCSTCLSRDLYYVAKAFESKGDWSAFETILDTMLLTTDFKTMPVVNYARVIESSLQKDGKWTGKYLEYCRGKRELTSYLFYREEKAVRQAIAIEDHRKASLILQDIISKCGSNQNKAGYEFSLCEQLSKGGDYDTADMKLKSFVERYRGENGRLAQQALMLQGQTLIQSGKVEQAMDSFLRVMIESTDSAERSKATYILGYCEMLQGNFEEATDTFDVLLKEQPNSVHADKARSHLERIRSTLN